MSSSSELSTIFYALIIACIGGVAGYVISQQKTRLRKANTRLLGRIKVMADKLPFPVWVRDREMHLIYCNLAYADVCDTLPNAVLSKQKELAPGRLGQDGKTLARSAFSKQRMQTQSLNLVSSGGQMRLYEVSEDPFMDGSGTIGYAIDHSAVDSVHRDLQESHEAQEQMLDFLHASIAKYSANGRLEFYNPAFAKIWGIETAFLDTYPSHKRILEHLRDQRILPEMADFGAFRDQRLRYFDTLHAPKEEMLHLPDGRTLRQAIIPHPLGGLLFVTEDVTDRLTLERNYRTLTSVQTATMENLHEAVAVFGDDGRLRLSNPAFAGLWNLNITEHLENKTHFSEMLEQIVVSFPEEQRENIQEKLSQRLSVRHVEEGKLTRDDHRTLEYRITPLPDGATMFSLIDITGMCT